MIITECRLPIYIGLRLWYLVVLELAGYGYEPLYIHDWSLGFDVYFQLQ